MAERKIIPDDVVNGFTLTSTWACRITYKYDLNGNPAGSTCMQQDLQTATKTIRFPVSMPVGAEFIGAKIHALHSTGLYGGTFKINGQFVDDDNFVTLMDVNFLDGYVDVVFSWQAYTDPQGTSAHSGGHPTYAGSTPEIVVITHESPSNVSDVYLLIEYKQNGIIYKAMGDMLVPHQIYRADNGTLAPYQLFKAVNGELVKY